MPSVYVYKSLKNRIYYIGSTKDFDVRNVEHLKGQSRYTKHLLPLILVFRQNFTLLKEARRVENKLKRYKSRKIIEQIIKDGFIGFVNGKR